MTDWKFAYGMGVILLALILSLPLTIAAVWLESIGIIP